MFTCRPLIVVAALALPAFACARGGAPASTPAEGFRMASESRSRPRFYRVGCDRPSSCVAYEPEGRRLVSLVRE